MPFAANIQPRRGHASAYLIATVAVLLGTGLVFLVPTFIERGAFIIFLAIVALVTWFGGWRPGVLAIVLTVLSAAIFILPPSDSIAIAHWEDILRLGVYVLVAGMITALHASREHAKDEAWQTEQRLAFALQCASMGAWCSNLKTGKFWWSPGMESLFGRPPGEFSGTYEGFIGYIHPEDQDFVKRAVTRTIEGGKEFEIEHRIVRPDGQTRWIITRGRITCDDHGHAEQVIGVAADVTNRKTQTSA